MPTGPVVPKPPTSTTYSWCAPRRHRSAMKALERFLCFAQDHSMSGADDQYRHLNSSADTSLSPLHPQDINTLSISYTDFFRFFLRLICWWDGQLIRPELHLRNFYLFFQCQWCPRVRRPSWFIAIPPLPFPVTTFSQPRRDISAYRQWPVDCATLYRPAGHELDPWHRPRVSALMVDIFTVRPVAFGIRPRHELTNIRLGA